MREVYSRRKLHTKDMDWYPNLFIHSRKAFKNCLVLWTLSVLSATEEAVEMALVREEKVFSVIK